MTSRPIRLLAALAVVMTLLLVGRGLGAVVAGVGRILVPFLLLVSLATIGVLLYRTVSTGNRAYPEGRYGIGRRVVVDEHPLAETPCTECGRSSGSGVRRRYVKELVGDGVPVALVSGGENVYCRGCVDPNTLDVDGEEEDADPVTETDQTRR